MNKTKGLKSSFHFTTLRDITQEAIVFNTQLILTFSNSTIETLEKGVKHVQNKQ